MRLISFSAKRRLPAAKRPSAITGFKPAIGSLQSTIIAACLLIFARAIQASSSDLVPPSESPVIRSWGTESGLPQNTVNAIVQSRDGYLWLGTFDGLARFDGMRFRVFGLEHGLPSVSITALCEDSQGVLWIGTSASGLCRMKDGRVETISASSRVPGSDTINCLQEDSSGRLWVGTAGGLRFCRGGALKEDSDMGGLSRGPVLGLLRSRDGKTIWISSSTAGLFQFVKGRLAPCLGPPGHEKIVGESLYEDRQGRLWVGIGNGMVLCRERESWRIYDEADGLPFAFITSLGQDAEGTIWAGSLDDGLYRFDGTRFNVLRRSDGLSAEDIRSLYCDHEGHLWIGTRTGGLNCLSRRKLLTVGSAQGLTNDYTRGVAQTPDGTLWVGTVGGSLYRGGPSKFEAFRPQDEPRVYFYASVYPVLTASDGSLWWGAAFGLLHWKDNRLADCITNEDWIKTASVTALQNDPRGGFWIGTSAGHLVHWRNGKFAEFPKSFTRAAITALSLQSDGTLWVGTAASGLKRIRAGSDAVATVTNGLSGTSSIRALYLDDRGVLWIGTAGGGLSCWRGGGLATFSTSQGMAPRTVSQIVEDDEGFLWLGCSRGIFKVHKSDLLDCASGKLAFVHCRSFGINDGMLAEECSGGFCPAGLKTKSGLICISTVKGLVFLDPKQLQEEAPPPGVLLEEPSIGGQPRELLDDAAPATSGQGPSPRLIVPPGARDIELHYTAIEFSTPEKISFRYQLDGLDRAWKEVGSQRVVNYPGLAPGNYTFHVQACNADGVWNPRDTTLAVTVLPFFWEARWFRVLTAAVALGLFSGVLWFVVRRRYKLRLARLQTLNAIDRERLRISKDMHDHVGSVLTQVSQLSDMGLNETEDQALVKNRLERIGNRARVAVQALDEIVWATNPKNDNLASFAEYVSRFSDEFFEYTNVRCWQEIPAALPALPLRADVRHNVFLAVREALTNALKHSHGTEVWLRIKLSDRRVTLEVQDNGCGFDPASARPGGNGLANMRARMSEDGGQTEVSSAPGKGTRIRFILPMTS